MKGLIRLRRPSPAMCVAVLALGVALNGTAIGQRATVSKIRNNSITSKHLKKGAIKAANLARGAVTTTAIKPGAVNAAAIAAAAVTAPALAPAAVTAPALGPAAVNAPAMAPNSVTASKLAPAAVTSISMAGGAVTGASMAAGAVTHDKMGLGAVHASNIADGMIKNEHVEPGSMQGAIMANGAILGQHLGLGAVSTSKIAQDVPGVSVKHTTTQSMPGGISTVGTLGTPVQFNSEAGLWDSGSLHDTTTNNHRLTAPQAGVYSIEAMVVWAEDPDGFRQLTLFKNGDPIHHTTAPPARNENGAPAKTPHTLSKMMKLAAGDWVEVRAMQFSESCNALCPAPLNIEANPSFAMSWELHG